MKIILSCFIIVLFYVNLHAQLIDQQVADAAEVKYNRFAKNRFLDINNSLLNKLKDASDIKKLNVVNTWVNQIRYKSDKKNYGVNDYWATLYEFVGKNRGDCEDYTITKYYILKELGIDPNRLKFTYVVYKNRQGKNISHMVLSYLKVAKPTSKDDILILGNNNRFVLPASKRPDIVKVIKMINGDTGAKSKKWKKLEANMKRKKL
ncbi:MAG: transglutaminase-like cysteine peptidase [Sulfurimonas sp.]